jgi:DNA-binding NarL/FixJ family response regulator
LDGSPVFDEGAGWLGAMGFVSKQAPGGTLLVAIRQVLKGNRYFSDELTQRILHRAADPGRSDATSTVDLLTDRELETFELIGAGLGSRDIASRMHVSHKTVDRYRENITKKLNITTSNELVHRATLWVEQNH